MAKMKIAVLISGRGSNLQSLIDACADDGFPAEIAVVIANRPDAKGLQRADEAGIDAKIIDHTAFPTRETFEDMLHATLVTAKVQLVCLAGFMRLLNAGFVNRWRDRMINIHPSLLPAFRGLHTQERAIESGVRYTGCTIHFVRQEMDDGPIILQAVCPIRPDDTADELTARVLDLEHRIYPEAVRLIARGKVRVHGNRALIKDCEWQQNCLINPMIGG